MKYLILLLFLMGFFTSSSFATPEYSKGIDYSTSSLGDNEFMVSGMVDTIIENVQVTMSIMDSNGKIIFIAQAIPDENRHFAFNVTKKEPLWQNVTDYSIIVNYQKPDANSEFYGRDIGSSDGVFRDIKEIPLPEDVRKTMWDTCSHMSNLAKEEKQFWETLHIRLIGDTPEFKSLEGMRGSMNITSGISATSCPPITGIDGTFISENGMRHKFQLGYNGNSFRYQIDAIFPPQYKEKLHSPLAQYQSGIASVDIKCKEGLEIMVRPNNQFGGCFASKNVNEMSKRGWGSPFNSYGIFQ